MMTGSFGDTKNGLGNFQAPPLAADEFELFRKLIRDEAGISLPDTKRDLLRGRLNKRLRHLKISSFADYYSYVCKNTDGSELIQLINCVTTNKTDFYREAHHFEFLTKTAFPELLERLKGTPKKQIRIWSAACSIGAEPYTIAITADQFFRQRLGWDVRILASDIDSKCLQEAARGVYDESRLEGIPLEIKRNYFLRGRGDSEGKVAVQPRIRQMVTFRRINFAETPWPFKHKFDIIFCRNAMIYFDRDFQDQLLTNFTRVLSPSGYLLLGHSENVAWKKELESIGQTIYRIRQDGKRPRPADPPSSAVAISPRHTAIVGASGGPRPSGNLGGAPTRQAGLQNSVQPQPTPYGGGATGIGSPSGGGATTIAQRMKAAPQAAVQRPTSTKSIVAGDVFASRDAVEISTLLGSCIAACLYDPTVPVGGMNHFLLPEGKGENSDTACYGIHAMELLINELMQRGGDRSRMVARLYGGAHVTGGQLKMQRVGEKNIEFVRKYLTLEGIPIVEQKVGGHRALRVSMVANTGEVVATELESTQEADLAAADTATAAQANNEIEKEDEGQIMFF